MLVEMFGMHSVKLIYIGKPFYIECESIAFRIWKKNIIFSYIHIGYCTN